MQGLKFSLFVLAIVLVLCANAAQAADVVFESGTNKVLRVENFEFDSVTYTVTFEVSALASEVYGPFPGTYTFTDANTAGDVRTMLVTELNAAGATELKDVVDSLYSNSLSIGFNGETLLTVEMVHTARAAFDDTDWFSLALNTWTYNLDERTYAIFTPGGGGGCSYTIDPTTASFPDTGGTGAVAVSTQSGCTWSATSNVDWVTVTSGGSGTGSGTVSYTVGVNSGGYQRTGKIQGSNKVHTITQDGNAPPTGLIFWDDFESGDTSWWSSVVP